MGLKNLFEGKKTTTQKNDDVIMNNNSSSRSVLSRSSSRARIEEELAQVFTQKIRPKWGQKDLSLRTGINNGSLGGQKPTETELENMIKEVDADVDLHDIIALNTKYVDLNELLENLKHAFGVFDIDNNGSISAEELQKVLGRLEESCTIEECKKMINGFGVDGDGMISFDEFKVMMMSGNGFGSKMKDE